MAETNRPRSEDLATGSARDIYRFLPIASLHIRIIWSAERVARQSIILQFLRGNGELPRRARLQAVDTPTIVPGEARASRQELDILLVMNGVHQRGGVGSHRSELPTADTRLVH